MSRRTLVIGLGLLGSTLAACSHAGRTQAGTVKSRRLHTVWRDQPDGPLPPRGGEGVPLTATAAGTTSMPSISRAALVGNLPDAQSAVYVTQTLPAPVRSIGARFGFTAGNDGGALCLACWTGQPPADTNFHFVITFDHWILGVIQGQKLSPIGDGPFSPGLAQDGTPLTVQGDLDGPTAALHLPDGTVHSIVDERISATPGWIAGWEFYKHGPGAAETLIYESWAA